MLSSVTRVTHPPAFSSSKHESNVTIRAMDKSMDEYLDEVKNLFEAPLQPKKLHALSGSLQEEFHDKLQSSTISMLPSYQHTLPTGHERGLYLAMDVGGSNFRLALVELTGKDSARDGMHVKCNRSFPIDRKVRSLEGRSFFDWMAARIQEMLAVDHQQSENGCKPLPMGLAWSFPIEQTSDRGGSLLAMGKGFNATHGVEGLDICDLIMAPCIERGLNVELQTIVNDSSATLLSQAYRDPTTRVSLILGTGTNAAIYLPVSALGKAKYGQRPQAWYDAADRVLVNTELSMYGKDKLPVSRWDTHINDTHMMPDFQPLEYKVGGRYLGEIVRLILVEAIRESGLFDGEMPLRFDEPYSLETGVIAAFESDTTASLCHSKDLFRAAHPISRPLNTTELQFIRQVSEFVTSRAAAYMAVAVHALWSLLAKSEAASPEKLGHITIACNGTVMERYPSFRARCQKYLDELTSMSGAAARSVTLEMAPESSIFGAAVAVSCLP